MSHSQDSGWNRGKQMDRHIDMVTVKSLSFNSIDKALKQNWKLAADRKETK